MRRLFGWLAGLVSVAALAKLLSRRKHEPELDVEPAPDPFRSEPDPAEELRRKLDEVRASAPADEVPGNSPPVDEEPSLDERRAAIHAKAHEAIDAMKPEVGE